MKTVGWIALRVVMEIARDRRTLAFFFLFPVLIMGLIYLALSQDEQAKIGVVARGTARLFVYDLERALEEEKNVEVVPVDIPDDLRDPKALREAILGALREGQVDGVLYFDEQLITDRFDGKRGTLHLFLEGSRPTVTGVVASAVAGASDDLIGSLPVVIDATCSAKCANSVNSKPMETTKTYLYGSEDFRTLDFFLPALVPFFVFFFTFLISNISFQRERLRGTLERLLIAPIHFYQVVLGYVGGFFLFALAQSTIVLSFMVALTSFPIPLPRVVELGVIALLMMVISLLLGLTVSFAARNEFQAIQFIPLVILPQVFLSDLIWDIQSFPKFFQWFSWLLPLTHANTAARNVVLKNLPLWQSWPQLLVLVGLFAAMLAVFSVVGGRRARNFV